jgi:hypothetical protein
MVTVTLLLLPSCWCHSQMSLPFENLCLNCLILIVLDVLNKQKEKKQRALAQATPAPVSGAGQWARGFVQKRLSSRGLARLIASCGSGRLASAHKELARAVGLYCFRTLGMRLQLQQWQIALPPASRTLCKNRPEKESSFRQCYHQSLKRGF